MTPETRAALALVDAGLPAAQVDRMLLTLDIGSADDAAAVTSKVDALMADVPALFGPVGAKARPSRPEADGQDAKVRARERFEDLGRNALRSAGITPIDRGRRPGGSGPGGNAA